MNLSKASKQFRVLVLSVVKHDYIARAIARHPRYKLVAVADDADQSDWVHKRNEDFAQESGIPYVRDVEAAIAKHTIDVAIVSSEAERHCKLSVRAADAGVHVIQDKPMSNRVSECDRLVDAVARNGVKFLMWNRNFLPAILQARDVIQRGDLGKVHAIHVDFYFAKDAGPPQGSRGADEPPMEWLATLKAAHVDGSDGGVGKTPMGELGIEGAYPLAYIAMLLGSSVRRVFARTASHFHQLYVDNHVEDLATVSLELDGGIVGSLCIGRIGAASHPDIGEIKLHIIGAKGALVVSEARPEIGVYYRDQAPSEFRNERLLAEENDYLLADDFANAIDSNGDTILDAPASRAITATMAAALSSAQSGTLVDVR